MELKRFELSTSALRTETRPSAVCNESPHERETGELRATAGATETWQWLAELADDPGFIEAAAVWQSMTDEQRAVALRLWESLLGDLVRGDDREVSR